MRRVTLMSLSLFLAAAGTAAGQPSRATTLPPQAPAIVMADQAPAVAPLLHVCRRPHV